MAGRIARVGRKSSVVDAGGVGQERGMGTEHLVPEDIRALYHVREWRNAAGVLMTACPGEWADILAVLRGFRLLRSEVLTAGGGLSPISQGINAAFGPGVAGGEVRDADPGGGGGVCLADARGRLLQGAGGARARMEQQGSVLRRDINNFRLLFDLRAIDVG